MGFNFFTVSGLPRKVEKDSKETEKILFPSQLPNLKQDHRPVKRHCSWNPNQGPRAVRWTQIPYLR